MNTKKQTKTAGLGLLELLVATAVFLVVAAIGVNILFSLMKGAAKTRVMTLVKQEGSYALSIMERMIRNAKSVVACGTDAEGDYVTIENPDEGQTNFHFCQSEALIASESDEKACGEARLTSDRVGLVSGSFSCQPPASDREPYVIGINFTLSQAGASPRPEEQTSIDFESTVGLRNLQ